MTARPIENVDSDQITTDNPTLDIKTSGATMVVVGVEAVDTTPVVKVYIQERAGFDTWRKWSSFQRPLDTGSAAYRAPNASITLVAGDQLIIPCAGAYKVRVEYQSGTSADINMRTADAEGFEAAIGAGEFTGGSAKTLTLTFARPANTDIYAAGDVVSDATSGAVTKSFANAVRAAGAGVRLTNAEMILSDIWTTALPQFRVELFNAAPSAQEDNEAYAPSEAERATCLGAWTFDGINDGYSANSTLRIPGFWEGGGLPAFSLASTSLYAVITILNASTPASGTDITINLGADRD